MSNFNVNFFPNKANQNANASTGASNPLECLLTRSMCVCVFLVDRIICTFHTIIFARECKRHIRDLLIMNVMNSEYWKWIRMNCAIKFRYCTSIAQHRLLTSSQQQHQWQWQCLRMIKQTTNSQIDENSTTLFQMRILVYASCLWRNNHIHMECCCNFDTCKSLLFGNDNERNSIGERVTAVVCMRSCWC